MFSCCELLLKFNPNGVSLTLFTFIVNCLSKNEPILSVVLIVTLYDDTDSKSKTCDDLKLEPDILKFVPPLIIVYVWVSLSSNVIVLNSPIIVFIDEFSFIVLLLNNIFVGG